MHSYGWKAIEKRRATENWEEINDLLTILLTSVDSETGEKMPDEQIARELGAFIAAGHETSAHSTLSPLKLPLPSALRELWSRMWADWCLSQRWPGRCTTCCRTPTSPSGAARRSTR